MEDLHPWLQKQLIFLGLKDYYPSKLKKKHLIKIFPFDIDKNQQASKGFMFLRKLLSVNTNCRSAFDYDEEDTDEEADEDVEDDGEKETFSEAEEEEDSDEEADGGSVENDGEEESFSEAEKEETGVESSLNKPCTYRTAIMLIFACADSFLRRYLVEKMQMCQFAVPVFLPFTQELLLYPLRITRSWTSSTFGVKECCLATEPMALVSVMQVGEFDRSVSSEFLNLMFNETGYNGFSKDMDGVTDDLCDGLVELAWFLPRGRESDIFTDAFAGINLHGDASNSPEQVNFLTETSDLSIIIAKSIDEVEDLLTVSSKINCTSELDRNGCGRSSVRKKIIVALNTAKGNLKKHKSKDHDFTVISFVHVEDIMKVFKKSKKTLPIGSRNLEERIKRAPKVSKLDEHDPKCKNGKAKAEQVMKLACFYSEQTTRENALPFQEKWKEWVDLDKQQTRGKKDELLLEELEKKKQKITENLRKSPLTNCFQTFLMYLKEDSMRTYFLDWLQYFLNRRSKRIEKEQEATLEDNSKDKDVLQKHKQELTKKTFGLEHFFREAALVWIVFSKGTKKDVSNVQWLPEVAASLLLEGFPLEILNGDASYVPLEWLREIFHSANKLEKKDLKVSVASILGVQSSGKSTFLNTMFGINFAVSSGRCTKGAYLQLVQVDTTLKNDLSCDYLAIVDTEGLKSAEQIEHDNERDNALGTLTVGISDVTLMNIGGETDESMKDVLQIVCHAFLRMTEAIDNKPRCMMVHQNVGDLSASKNTSTAKVKFLQTLDKMTQVAAQMENCMTRYKTFEDVIHYDASNMDIYIPGLWHGSPPMASVNIDYSEAAQNTKTILLQEIRTTANTLQEFVNRLKHVKQAVDEDNFIFSFRNSIAAIAYQNLANEFEQQKWKSKTEFLNWLETISPKIKQSGDYSSEKQESVKIEGREEIAASERHLKNFINGYFTKHQEVATLLENYRSLLERDIEATSNGLISQLNIEVQRIFKHLIAERNFDRVVSSAEAKLEPVLLKLKEKHSIGGTSLSVEQVNSLEQDFENEWSLIIGNIDIMNIEECNIASISQNCLKQYVKCNEHHMNKKLWLAYSYKVDMRRDIVLAEYIKTYWIKTAMLSLFGNDSATLSLKRAQHHTEVILEEVKRFVCSITETPRQFREEYYYDIMSRTNEMITNVRDNDFQFKMHYIVNMMGLVSDFSARKLTKMHEEYKKTHDPEVKLRDLKNSYFTLLLSLVEKGNQEKIFGQEVIEGILNILHRDFKILLRERIGEDKLELCNVKQMQVAILVELHKSKHFTKYVGYLHMTKSFVLRWIHEKVLCYLSESIEDEPTRYIRIMTERARHVLEQFLGAMQKASTCAEYHDFLHNLQREVSMHDIRIDLTDDRIRKLEMLAVEDFEDFIHNLKAHFQKVTMKYIEDQLKEDNIEDELRKMIPSIEEQLYEKLMCKDGAQCPFCAAPCNMIGPHQKHGTDMHQPQGLRSWRYHETDKLAPTVCPVNVASTISTFKSDETNWEPVPFADYQKYYPDWFIPADANPTTSKYWKMVLMNYNAEFAKWYGCKEADIPESWRGFQWPVVKADLEDLYDTRIRD